MICYLYDGSFEGLLTVIYRSYYDKIPDNIEIEGKYNENFLYEYIKINTEEEKYRKVYNAILEKISKETLELIYYAYLSQTSGVEYEIYKYLKMAFKIGFQIKSHIAEETVLKMEKLKDKVKRESIRMLEFIRFTKVDENFYYTQIEPDYYLLQIITDHFAKRLQDQNFIIHDLKREMASIYNKKEWIIIPLTFEEGEKLKSEDSSFYEKLWLDYFKSIAIEERKNEKLQRGHMPRRYWKHIIEMKDIGEK